MKAEGTDGIITMRDPVMSIETERWFGIRRETRTFTISDISAVEILHAGVLAPGKLTLQYRHGYGGMPGQRIDVIKFAREDQKVFSDIHEAVASILAMRRITSVVPSSDRGRGRRILRFAIIAVLIFLLAVWALPALEYS